jgi:hypothetical protein
MPNYTEEDLYGQQSSLMNNVNQYMSANTANVGSKPSTSSNPYGFDLSALSRLGASGFNIGDAIGGALFGDGSQINLNLGQGYTQTPTGGTELDPSGGGGGGGASASNQAPNSLLSKFIGELQVLDKSQRDKLLSFVTGGGGDKVPGVSADEYAELFGVDSEYAPRFQGFPALSNLVDDIQNVYNYGAQQRGFEQRAAQEANIASGGGRFQGGMGFSGFGARGASGQRRSLMDTLNQRRASIAESEASKYGQLLNSIASQLTSGFGIAGNILQENPQAQNQGGTPQEGDERLIGGVNYVYTNGTWTNADEYYANQRAMG